MINEVKNYLKIVWDEEDNLIDGIILRGKAYLDNLMDAELDYEVEGPPKSLLLDYCRYVYNNASEYFEENFAREILRLQLQIGIKEMAEDEIES